MPQNPIMTLIEQAMQGLRYGSIHLIVHEGKLVRIERMDRIRIPTEPMNHLPPEKPEDFSTFSDPSPSRRKASQEGHLS